MADQRIWIDVDEHGNFTYRPSGLHIPRDSTEPVIWECALGPFAVAFKDGTDVPEGAQNLGWVTVKKGETDEETFVKLREKICGMGGDALSQPAWVRQAGEYEPTHLKANAWVLP